jgi:hypothetical protein
MNFLICKRAKYILSPQRLKATPGTLTRKRIPPIAASWLMSISLAIPGIPAIAEPPVVEEVLIVLGMEKDQLTELTQGEPILFELNEGTDELASGIALYLPVPLTKVTGQLRLEYPNSLDVDVTAHGRLTEQDGVASLATFILSRDEARALLDAEPGNEFNLSTQEIANLRSLKPAPGKAIEDVVVEHYRKILFQRFEAYRHGGTFALAPYAREHSLASMPSLELHQAAKSNAILAHYFPELHKVWLNYPKNFPQGSDEAFPWVQKKVENRSAIILRHRVNIDWSDGVLVLTREFYASHSYNASQWITGCLPYGNGTVIFQQVRSFTDQVSGLASEVKHLIGRELLKVKMLKSFERLCVSLDQCR